MSEPIWTAPMNLSTATGASTSPEIADSCQRSGHPLEALKFFRRFRPSVGRDLAYTFIWNMGFVVGFAVLALLFDPDASLRRVLWVNFVIANCIGYLIHLGFSLSHRLLGESLHRLSFAMRAVYYATVSIAGGFGGYWLGFTLLSWHTERQWIFSAQGAITIVLLGLMISGILATVFYARERQAKAEADFHSERARVASAEHGTKVAELKLLQAQVEPHFLYNTLANVISLIDANPSLAKRLVERLIDYLRRAALAATTSESTLGGQLELLRAYLDLIVLRMGSRLAYRIEVPADLMSSSLPPMLLQPLVENAIKHGIEPATRGGEVIVSARRESDCLVLTVADDGVGLRGVRSEGSTGIGLANLRERLEALYGGRATLTIRDRSPGTVVTITVPVAAS
jgi:signal transduction histidine kinase